MILYCFPYLFGECTVLVKVLYLIIAQGFSAVGTERAAVWLGCVVLIAAVILSCDRFTLKHGVELGGTL